MEDHNIPYFRNLWKNTVSNLENQCKIWEKICSNKPVPDDVLGEIRTVIGLARLLVNQKLKQFNGLIDDSEFCTGEKEITCTDLEGFWDMVYFEVEKILKSFDRLDACKSNEWRFIEENSEKLLKKKVPLKKDINAISKKKEISRAQMSAVRQRIAEARKKMIASQRETDQTNVEILLPNKPEKTQEPNPTVNTEVINTCQLNAKNGSEESKENKKQDLNISRKKSSSYKTDLIEESVSLNDSSNHSAAQKKRSSFSNKENVIIKNSSDGKYTPAKQAKPNENEVQGSGKTRSKQSSTKLQCVTRSAAKRALLLQQNASQMQ